MSQPRTTPARNDQARTPAKPPRPIARAFGYGGIVVFVVQLVVAAIFGYAGTAWAANVSSLITMFGLMLAAALLGAACVVAFFETPAKRR